MKYQTIFNGGANSYRSSYSIRGWMLSEPGDLVTFRFFNLSNITCSLNIGSLNDDWQGLGCELGGS